MNKSARVAITLGLLWLVVVIGTKESQAVCSVTVSGLNETCGGTNAAGQMCSWVISGVSKSCSIRYKGANSKKKNKSPDNKKNIARQR